jgi:DNA-binding NarL/FixJ family response regulator
MKKSMNYKIGVIDDNEMMFYAIEHALKTISKEIEVVPINLHVTTIREIINEIVFGRFDALIIDYLLDEYEQELSFDGIEISNEIEREMPGFPIFILTAHEQKAEEDELSNVHQIYVKDRYVDDMDTVYREKINRRIILQIEHYKNKISIASEKLIELLNKEELSDEEKEIIINLDHLIEKSILGTESIPHNIKVAFENDVTELVKLTEELLEEVKKNNEFK